MNKKNTVIFVPGNPNTCGDIDAVKACFDTTSSIAHWHTVSRPINGASIDALLESMEAEICQFEQSHLIILAYSWGCYLSLRWLEKTKIKPAAIIFISPTIFVDKPLSKTIHCLSRIPILSTALLKKVAPKQVDEFLARSFSPARLNVEQQQQLKQGLSSVDCWRGAINYKYQQQKKSLDTLTILLKAPLILLQGKQDQVVNNKKQQNCLERIVSNPAMIKAHTIEAAGHGLIWTHAESIKIVIKQYLKENFSFSSNVTQKSVRIGYESGVTSDNNVINYLLSNAQQRPNNIALRWFKANDISKIQTNNANAVIPEEISYDTFGQYVERTAKCLKDLGIEKGDKVILFLPMGMPMYTAMFAIQWIGAIAVFLDSWARRDHLSASAKCVEPKAMISHEMAFNLIDKVPEFNAMPLRIISTCYPLSRYQPEDFNACLEDFFTKKTSPIPLASVESEHTALITFTTGSSGEPKGANRTHRFLCAQHEALEKVIPYLDDDVDVPAFPIFSLNNLACGITSFIPALDLAMPSKQDSAALAHQINHYLISCATLSPSMLNNLSKFCINNSLQLQCLRRVITGGAPISKDNVQDFKSIAPNAEIHILYGSTEVEPMGHIEAKEMLSLPENTDPEVIEEGVNVGHIAEGLRYKFIRPIKTPIYLEKTSWEMLEVKAGEVGEFVVSGGHVCESYYNNEKAFYKTKIREADGTIWHRTGDLARMDKQGYLWIVGRIHNMIIRGSNYLFPVSAEIILKRCDFLKQGAFLGIPDEKLGEKTAIAAEFVEGYDDFKQGIEEISRLMRKNNIAVDAFYAITDIPMDPRHHSKVDYGLLRDKLVSENIEDIL